MRSQIWNNILGVAAVACLVGEAIAQTSGPLAGLDELLGKQKNLTIFRSYLKKYPQILADVKAGDGITILAPDDTAMTARIPASILKVPFETNDTNVIINALQYHVLLGTQKDGSLVNSLLQNRETLLTDSKYSNQTGGERVTYFKAWDKVVTFISGLGTRCTLLVPDLEFSNGVVHIIDSPLIPPQPLIPTTTQYNLTGFQGSLFAAAQTEQLTKAKTLTLFAPRNEAFQALGPAISTMTAEQLGKVLAYHAISNDTIYSPDLKNGSTLVTTSGQELKVRIFGNLMFINSAQVTEKDILIANGVLHTIDAVLNPDDAGGVPNPDVATQKPVYPAATAVADIPFTSAIPCTTACDTAGATGVGGGKGSSSKAAAPPRETGFSGAVKLAAAVVGGAVMMI